MNESDIFIYEMEGRRAFDLLSKEGKKEPVLMVYLRYDLHLKYGVTLPREFKVHAELERLGLRHPALVQGKEKFKEFIRRVEAAAENIAVDMAKE